MLRFFVFICCLIFSNLAVAQDGIGENSLVSKFVNDLDERKAVFMQIKTFERLNKRFVVEGRVRFVKGEGVVYRQDTPRSMVFIADKQKYCIDGVEKDIASLPYVDKFKSLVDNVLSGKYDELYKSFYVDYKEIDAKQWELDLRPTYSNMEKFIKNISVLGTDKDLLKISIDYTNKMKLVLIFDVLNTDVDKDILDEIKC